MKNVTWTKVITWQNQILAWGVKPQGLVLARANGAGHTEYFSWPEKMKPENIFIPLVAPERHNKIVLYTPGMNTADKQLVQNKYFQEELKVFHPQFLHNNLLGIGTYYEEIVTLHHEHEVGTESIGNFGSKRTNIISRD